MSPRNRTKLARSLTVILWLAPAPTGRSGRLGRLENHPDRQRARVCPRHTSRTWSAPSAAVARRSCVTPPTIRPIWKKVLDTGVRSTGVPMVNKRRNRPAPSSTPAATSQGPAGAVIIPRPQPSATKCPSAVPRPAVDRSDRVLPAR
ncbi:hypothetical protein DSL92_07965 [Billgrantia gudaonensis]|uniref:Uncharacterized protein n=1 Tax=Billgrantia gudaonensis TaxID=376427 RepID=A0A3S0NEF3_9GAMM|nr:hypothetical protein DSL92_07965 [Halomonas gudaonensis]